MKRVLLVVAYDGTNYNGWQIQPNGNTIEGQLNKHLSELLQEEIQVIGASRTDAGVHAKCNMAVFDTNVRMPADKISYALNQRLPEDIKIRKSLEVPGDFHPRKIHTKKTYEYRIYNAEFPSPLHRLHSHFTYVPLDVEKMKEAATYFVGEHDFFSFSTYKPEVESTVRTIYELVIEEKLEENDFSNYENAAREANDAIAKEKEITEKKHEHRISPKMICIRVSGNGFLYNMVRIIAGTLMEVGRGRMAPTDIPRIMEERDRQLAGPTAPANGLTLAKYEICEANGADG